MNLDLSYEKKGNNVVYGELRAETFKHHELFMEVNCIMA
jgi:hypothetical protein